jgi:hypothetical protein
VKFINLTELEERVKLLDKPRPQDVLNLIQLMYSELKNK